ncbi:MAG: Low molecular weight phosphotyrosine protein phosphatase, partial [Actinomycetota bacterium]|nr:Low molecular weight phosphotyrosine protein phosphatase [Actinomycetota bacterium]
MFRRTANSVPGGRPRHFFDLSITRDSKRVFRYRVTLLDRMLTSIVEAMLGSEPFSAAGPEVAADLFRLLFLCTGNRCRSPLAEALVRQFTTDLPIVVASAAVLSLPP